MIVVVNVILSITIEQVMDACSETPENFGMSQHPIVIH